MSNEQNTQAGANFLTNDQIAAGAAIECDHGAPIGRNVAIDVFDAMRAAAPVAAQAGQVAVPTGFVLVPEKPTEAMINAFYGPLASVAVSYFDWDDGGDEAYSAMLAAAPSPAKESK